MTQQKDLGELATSNYIFFSFAAAKKKKKKKVSWQQQKDLGETGNEQLYFFSSFALSSAVVWTLCWLCANVFEKILVTSFVLSDPGLETFSFYLSQAFKTFRFTVSHKVSKKS